MTSKETIRKRLEMLRAEMKSAGIDEYLVTSSDFHASEYVGDYFKVTEYLSGCTSDNVRLLISNDAAYLWTDGRYFISAAEELQDTGIKLMKMGETGVPTPTEFLRQSLGEEMVLGFDGRCVSAHDGEDYRRAAKDRGAEIESVDLVDRIWLDRPPMSSHPVLLLDESLTGEGTDSKLTRVREYLKRFEASYLVLSKLDDIMWLFNFRGRDIACNPVALSYAVVGLETADLFIQSAEVTDEFRTHTRNHLVKLHEYGEVYDYIRDYHFEGRIFADRSSSSDTMIQLLKEKEEVIFGTNPTTLMKAVKNETELGHLREVYLKDSVELCRFICRVERDIGKKPMTEVTAAYELDHLRSQIPGYLDLSFPTISAYGPNAAMAHYAPDAESAGSLLPIGFLLVDSGAQYLGGTTDVTRTIPLGPLSDEMKMDFTLVAAANLRLLYAKFPYGCTGVNLDTFARAPLWKYGKDFNHGTGHGIGYILNVHEGPQNIRWRANKRGKDWAFEAGMITSDEPGIYVEGKYGIRTETITECVDAGSSDQGRFLTFRPLTFVPIAREALDLTYFSEGDRKLFNDYHRQVREQIAPHLEGEELDWLLQATEPIEE